MTQSTNILKKLATLLVIIFINTLLSGQENAKVKVISLEPFSDSSRHWYGIKDDGNIVNPVANQPKYAESEITNIADNVLLYQKENGGWPKNYDIQAIMTPEQVDKLLKAKNKTNTTFDNSTTYTHIEYLAKAYTITKIEKYKEACLKGIRFVLSAQYPNGGWPQYFPLEENYSRHITFNDGAYIGIMDLFKKINNNDPNYLFIDSNLRKQIRQSYNKGLDCILNCQIKVSGRLTAWCQQHDEITLQPAKARAYELPSICNGESVGIVLHLMNTDHPDQRIIESVQAAIQWFKDSRIYNTSVKTIKADPEKTPYKISTSDRIVINDSLAPPIWNRFYEQETARPMFSDRNSKVLYSLAEVSRERRDGYGWYTYNPQQALDKYPEWEKKWIKPLPNLTVSSNGRYINADGKPFFWLGDTGWLLLSKLNREEAEKYLEDRSKKGFNVIQVMVLHSLTDVSVNGDSALIRKNVARPNITPANITNPHAGYWDNLDYVVDLAAKKGIYLGLVPVWSANVRAGLVSRKQAEVYARFLAERYKNKSNIIWLNGGDVRGDDSIQTWNLIGNTLKKYDQNHLVTFHPFGRTQSSEWFHKEKWLDINMFQSGHRSYNQDSIGPGNHYGEDNWRYVQADYAKTPVKPTLDGEPSYEGIPHGLHDTLQPLWKDQDVRRYAYWSVFSGGCGFTYGNSAVMQMHKKGEKTGAYGTKESWEEAINAPGAGQMVHLKNLMLIYHLEKLVPDQSILSDQGERYNHLVALRGDSAILIYTYNGRPIQLKSIPIKSNHLIFRWFNPRDGKFWEGGKIEKTKLKELDPPGKMEDGNDWVLVLENK